MKHIKLTFRDTFSHCTTTRQTTVSQSRINNIKSDIGKVVKKQFSNGINFQWRLEKVTDLNDNHL